MKQDRRVQNGVSQGKAAPLILHPVIDCVRLNTAATDLMRPRITQRPRVISL